MPYIGAVALIIAAFMIWREYCLFLDAQLGLCRAYIRALSDLKEKMKSYLTPIRDWAREYDDGLLSECGFLGAIREGGGVREAYLSSTMRDRLPEGADEKLISLFSRLGGGYLEGEVESLDGTISGLAAIELEASGERIKRKRAVGALIGAVVLGIVIMII